MIIMNSWTYDHHYQLLTVIAINPHVENGSKPNQPPIYPAEHYRGRHQLSADPATPTDQRQFPMRDYQAAGGFIVR